MLLLQKLNRFLPKHWWIIIPLSLLALIAAHWMALIYRIQPAVSLWFPPSGVAIALSIWFGPIGIFLTALSSILMAPMWGNEGWTRLIAITDVTEPLIAWFIYRRLVKGSLIPNTLRDAAAFTLAAPLIACATSAVLGSLGLVMVGKMPASSLLSSIPHWWLGNAIGTIAIAPTALLLLTPILQKKGWLVEDREQNIEGKTCKPQHSLLSTHKAEILTIVILIVTIAALTVAKTNSDNFEFQQLSFLSFIPIIWAATRFGITGGMLASSFCVLVTLLNYLIVYPNAISLPSFPLPAEVLSTHKLSLLVQCAVSLFVGCAIAERTQAQVALAVEQLRLAEFEERVQLSEKLIELNASLTEINTRLEESNREKDELLSREQIAVAKAENMRDRVTDLLESITQAFFAVDSQWRFTYVNQQAETILQKSKEQLLNRNIWELYTEAIDTTFFREYHRAVADRVTVTFEEFYPPLNIWVEVHAYPTTEGLSVFFRDISNRKQIQTQLEESEARFRTSVENTIDCFGIYSAIRDDRGKIVDFRIDYVNAAACTTNLLSREEQIGKKLCEILPGHKETKLFDAYCQVVETGQPFIEDSVIYEDYFGSVRLLRAFDIRIAKLGDGFVANWRDITVRKKAEEELYLREQEFKALAENSPDIIARVDKQLRHLYVNSVIEEVTGIPPAEFIGKSNRDLGFPEQTVLQWEVVLQKVFESGEECTTEFSFPAINGITRYYQSRLVPEFDRDGSIGSVLGVTREITELKQIEAALRESESRLRRIVESNIIGIFFGKTSGEIDEANDAFLEMLGYSREDLLAGKINWDKMTPPEYRDRTYQAVEELKNNRVFVPFEKEFIRQDGSRVFVQIAGALLEDSPDRGVCYVLDLTERKQIEQERAQLLAAEQEARQQAETANRVKDEFLAVLSHELRSPLNPILGWAKLLRTRPLDEKTTAKALETIERNAYLQSRLIEDLLDVSRIIRGKLTLSPITVDLVSTIDAAMETVRLAAEAKSIQLKFSCFDLEISNKEVSQQSSKSNCLVLGDPNRLQQIIWNLLSNAVKFTPAGGRVEIQLSIEECQEKLPIPNSKLPKPKYARIQVIDTGKGINPDFLPFVFESFRQENSQTTRTFGGLGLGLAIVRHLVELHGGTVFASSLGEGLGATFTVKLPLMSAVCPIATDEILPPNAINLEGVKILLVDDDADARELVSFILKQYGVEVTAVASATEAIEVMSLTESYAKALQKPDLLLTDIGMPHVDGYMLLRQIRRMTTEQGGQIPAIALTAYAGETDRQQIISAGFHKHVTKPVELTELVMAIASAIGRTS